jgi:hypothetical protein
MTNAGFPPDRSAGADDLPADVTHPKGTLAVVAIFGVLFTLGWLLTYVFVFIGRGAPHH